MIGTCLLMRLGVLRVLGLVPAILGILMVANEAAAATREVRFMVRFYDTRSYTNACATISEVGSLRGCAPAGDYGYPDVYRQFVGGTIELWDKDGADPADDDLIGEFPLKYFTSTGKFKLTFHWEGMPYQIGDGETHPDLYIVVKPVVQATTGSGPSVRVMNTSHILQGVTGYRDSAVIADCTGVCSMPFYLDVSHSASTPAQQDIYNVADTSQHMLEVYAPILGYLPIDALYQSTCSGGTAAGSNGNRSDFCITEQGARRGETPAHELGHLLQKRLFNQDSIPGGNCSGDGGITVAQVNDTCATTEGWAVYVAARSWWDPAFNGFPTGPDNSVTPPGYDLEEATCTASSYSGNRRIIGQVAKAFWDLDDANNEAAIAPSTWRDYVDLDTLDIANVWANFPNGSGNHQNDENDANSINLFDYYFNGPLNIDRNVTLIEHNCLGSQDQN